jgi:tRNA (mo5U34)-methyltransferase
MEKSEADTLSDIQSQLDQYYWHHTIDLGRGIVTNGAGSRDVIEGYYHALYDNLDLVGKDLLDIGAWNGAYSFEAKRRGCARVVASDKYCWTAPRFKGRETFDLARSINGLDVEAHEIDVPDITPSSAGTFDVVLFSGVFYHLINPVHLTRQISECARHVLILETHQDLLDDHRPGMVFYPGAEINGDSSNWWGPNPRAIYGMLREFGFARIFYQDSPGFDNHARGIFHAFRTEESFNVMSGSGENWLDLSQESVRQRVFSPLPSEKDLRIESLESQCRNVKELETRCADLQRRCAALENSNSWKLTAPLRTIRRLIKG